MVLIRCKENFPDIYLPVLLSLMLGTRVSETLVLRYPVSYTHLLNAVRALVD